MNRHSLVKIQFPIILFTSIFLGACAHDTQKDAKMTEPRAQNSAPEAESKDAVSIEAKLAAAQDDTTNVTEVIFEKGTNRLSTSYQKKIDVAFVAAEKKSPVSHVTIVAWSDSELPNKNKPLSEKEIDLAKVRAETIEQTIHATRPKVSTEIVNMAERPGKLKEFLKTNDVRIQQALTVAGTGDKKASHAVVIIETKQNK